MSKSRIGAIARKFIEELGPQVTMSADEILEAWGPVNSIGRDSSGSPAQRSITVLLRWRNGEWSFLRRVDQIENGHHWTAPPFILKASETEARHWLTQHRLNGTSRDHLLFGLVSIVALLYSIVAISLTIQAAQYGGLLIDDKREVFGHDSLLPVDRGDASANALTTSNKSEPPETFLFAVKDPAERNAIQNEFSVIVDREPITRIEMPAYWRLVRWAGEDSLETLKGQARRDVPFTQFLEAPAKFRGTPVRIHLHLTRSLWHSPEYNNPAGVSRIFEGRGFADESRTNSYCVVFTERPNEMPIGPHIRENVTFHGFFLKLLPPEAGDDKRRATPLFIGRLEWNPPHTAKGIISASSWLWPSIGGMLLLGISLFALQRYAHRTLIPPNFRFPEDELISHRNQEVSGSIATSREQSPDQIHLSSG